MSESFQFRACRGWLVAAGAAAIVMALAGGCASQRPAAAEARDDAATTSTAMRPLEGARDVVVLAAKENGGSAVSWEDLVYACSRADVVIIGEQHGHPLGLAAAASLFEDVVKASDSASLSMEFFERDEQSRLDDYLTGVSDEATFRRRTGRNDSNYPEGHRAMVEAARQAGRKVYAANAPRGLVRLARRDGYGALLDLTEEQRRLVRIPDALPGPENPYRQEFESLMAGALSHGHGTDAADPEAQSRMVEAMLRAQTLWDWTMAHTIARAVSEGNVPVVHVVGRFHSDFDGGMVQALGQLAGGAGGLRIVTISMSDRWSDHVRSDDQGRADFVMYVGPGAE